MKTVQIVGILNTTPDSYFDGGKYDAVDAALSRATEMIAEGADIIEIGGESTGPGAKDVTLQQETDRTIPIIQAIRKAHPGARLSIDTYKAQLARQAIEHGVSMVNDVTAGRGDADMFAVIAQTGVDYVMMYAKDETPRTTVQNTEYADVIETVSAFLQERIIAAKKAEVDVSHIIIDPGMGHFLSADPKYSFEVIANLHRLTDIAPVFVSPSRKSFLAGTENVAPSYRLPATIVATLKCVDEGAMYIRTHDVADIRRSLETQAMLKQIQDHQEQHR